MTPAVHFGPLAVAIPARDEADRIGLCLEALNNQTAARLDHIVLVVNNTTDDTAERARAMPMNPATTLHVIECTSPPEHVNAGYARRLAMEQASLLAGSDGVLLTTDADAQVDPDWVAANLAALRAGADVVAGWVELDPIEWGMIPLHLHEDDAHECAYDALCDGIHEQFDPDQTDPMPRHTQHSGASLAVTAAAYGRSGGIPLISCGEDRALVSALRRIDSKIRHALEVHVTVSDRIDGRSLGAWPIQSGADCCSPTSFSMTDLNPRRIVLGGHGAAQSSGGPTTTGRLISRLSPNGCTCRRPNWRRCCAPLTLGPLGRTWRKSPHCVGEE